MDNLIINIISLILLLLFVVIVVGPVFLISANTLKLYQEDFLKYGTTESESTFKVLSIADSINLMYRLYKTR